MLIYRTASSRSVSPPFLTVILLTTSLSENKFADFRSFFFFSIQLSEIFDKAKATVHGSGFSGATAFIQKLRGSILIPTYTFRHLSSVIYPFFVAPKPSISGNG
jgi:hypothetical protein